MSETPRTDKSEKHAYEFKDEYTPVCESKLVRQLERELNAAHDRINRLEEFVDQLTNPKFTRDDLPKEALLQRIKRLEEAGDAMERYCDAISADNWRKAKEEKP